jgi:1-aminocyclopropane-1-carboxylate synthase
MDNNEYRGLSKRGIQAWKRPLRVDFTVYNEAIQNAFHAEKNPEGCFLLNIAENKCTADLMHDKIHGLLQSRTPAEWVRNYTSPGGHPDFLKAFASFYETQITHESLNERGLAASAGATSVIDLTSQIIAEPGDAVAFPAPNYPAYTPDIGNKGGLKRIDFDLLGKSLDAPRKKLTSELLNSVLQKAHSEGRKLSALILTQPDNPMGHVYTKNELEEATNWCIQNKVHLIVNEIYALSQFDHRIIPGTNHWPNQSFHSFVPFINRFQSDFLHLWYSLSKDFCSSGYRVGFIYSANQALIEAYSHWNGPSMVSNITQWIFTNIFHDQVFLENYRSELKKSISKSCKAMMDVLDEIGLKYITPQGSLFLWIDFSPYMKGSSLKDENALWMEIYQSSGLLLTPGEGFGHKINRGCFRMVYSCIKPSEVPFVQDRLRKLSQVLKS